MKKLYRLTPSGLEELKAELAKLIAARPVLAEAIRVARELGDLSENDEYRSSRSEQERNEARIAEIENILLNVEVIKKPHDSHVIALGSFVKLKNNKLMKEFQIVGTVEADPLNGKISDESPIGMELIGKKIGDKVVIKTPNETIDYEIVTID